MSGAGLALRAPFLDPQLAGRRGCDPDKRELRELGRRLGLRGELVAGPKLPRLAPALDLARHWDGPRIAELAREVGRTVSVSTDRLRVAWTSLGLFAKVLDACVASRA